MKTTQHDHEKGHRFYIMQTAAGWLVWRVRFQDTELFLELFGDFIAGSGDTAEEALADRERLKTEAECSYFEKVMEKMLGIEDEVRITIADLYDWIKGKG